MKPNMRPARPDFSSGPCAKRPGWTPEVLLDAAVGRSHRSKLGKKKIVERKLYPGYIVVKMHINDDTWFAVRETSGIGDFTGAGGKPSPMLPHEVARIVQTDEEESSETPKLDIRFKTGERVKVKDGTFEGFEGEVGAIDSQSGKITVMINIFGRSTPVELEYWQVEGV